MAALPTPILASTPVKLPWQRGAPTSLAAPSVDATVISDFLQSTIADAIHLVSIVPDGAVAGRWFGDSITDAAVWAAERNAEGANVYWTVNRVREGLNAKPKKGDIAAARYQHVDIDPPKDGTPWRRDEALAALSELDSPPSFVIDSGGGLQAFWRLEEESLNFDAIEATNRGIMARFGADACWNIDRLMRVPGTINWPDARKLTRGRVPALARIVEPDDGTVHEAFVLAHRFPPPTAPERVERPAVEARAATTLITADDLGLAAFDPLRMLIERPGGADRSADALRCAGEMVRAGRSDAEVMGILLNPANAVSAHCLHHRDPHYAAARCLSRARGDQQRVEEETAQGAAIAAGMGIGVDNPDDALDFEDVSEWTDLDVGEQEWVVDGWMPLQEATLLTGAGAIGKSLLAQQLAACVGAGKPFMGVPVVEQRSAYITCEDPRKVLVRRQQAIARAIGVPLSNLAGRCWARSWRGKLDNELVTFDRDRQMRPTARYAALRDKLLTMGISFVVLDNTSHLFGGDENSKREVTAFMNLLNRLAEEIGGAVLLLGHPNKAGANDGATRGNQYGGSIGWENATRSRMFMTGDPNDNDARELVNPKANYSAKGTSLRFRWHDGAFRRLEDLPTVDIKAITKKLESSAEDEAFLACLDERNRNRRSVSDRSGTNYAPAIFAGMEQSQGVSKEAMKRAMERLISAGTVVERPLWHDGRNGRWVYGFCRADDDFGAGQP